MGISTDGTEITIRFFKAIELLKANGKIRGTQTFTNAYGINRRNFISVRKKPETSFLKPEWILWLCRDYNISLEWIFFGTGFFFNREKPDEDKKQIYFVK